MLVEAFPILLARTFARSLAGSLVFAFLSTRIPNPIFLRATAAHHMAELAAVKSGLKLSNLPWPKHGGTYIRMSRS
uniref:Putative secreted protein n=1 Tax=Anopheles darlingi TaxID=43151 RepID=A0A2M4DAS8_ANODA